MNAVARESLYSTLARVSGLALIVICVLFQRRGLMHWSELVFLGLCIAVQETFLRVGALRRLRTPMMVVYSLMPLALVLYHSNEIRSYQGDFVQIVLRTPLPLVLVSVQIMVLYVREAARLVSVVLVLALFSTVIGVRRLDDVIWPWLAAIGAAGTLFLMLQHPGMLFQGVYISRRRGPLPPTGRPGGIMRAAFFTVLPMFTVLVLVMSLMLYVAVPRIEAQQGNGQGYEVGTDPANSNRGIGGPTDTGRNPRNPRDPRNSEQDAPASVSGLSAGVDLGDFGEIKRSTTPALNLKLTAPEGKFLQRVYLRAFTYGTFDGMRWAPIAPGVGTREVPVGTLRNLPGNPDRPGWAFEMRQFAVTLKEAGIGAAGQLPVPVEATTITGYSGALYYDSVTHTLQAPSIKAGDAYEVVADQIVLSDDQLARRLGDSKPAPAPKPEYLDVPPMLKEDVRRRFNTAKRPEDGLYDRYAAIVARRAGSTPQQRGVYAAARGLVDMFHNATTADNTKAWTYSLDFRPKPGTDAIARFLDTGSAGAERFGHCEYFASAMCILMRCYGVPARVCAGFLAQRPNAEGVFEVTASAAHAWVEVYFDEWGWIAFDPTPPETSELGGEDPTDPEKPSPEPEEPADPDKPDGAAAGEGAQTETQDWLRSYDGQAQREMFSGVRDMFDGLKDRLGKLLDGLTAWMPDALPASPYLRALMLVVPGALVVAAVIWRRRKRRRMEAKVLEQMGEGGRKRERGLYFQLLLLLARYGFQKRASETPREFAQRVLRRGGGQHVAILELTELYYGLRFGERSLEAEFKAALAKYADGLRDQRGLDRAQGPGSSASPAGAQPG